MEMQVATRVSFETEDRRLIDLHRAATNGDLSAQSALAISLFRCGRRAEAMPWISLAAGAGEPRCQYLLGVALHNGDFLPRDLARAKLLLQSAAGAGVGPACAALATISESAIAAVAARPLLLDDLAEALLRPMLASQLDSLLPMVIEREVARSLARNGQLSSSRT